MSLHVGEEACKRTYGNSGLLRRCSSRALVLSCLRGEKLRRGWTGRVNKTASTI